MLESGLAARISDQASYHHRSQSLPTKPKRHSQSAVGARGVMSKAMGCTMCMAALLIFAHSSFASRTLGAFNVELPSSGTGSSRMLLGASDHVYKVHEKVALYANKVGPFHNPRCVIDNRFFNDVL